MPSTGIERHFMTGSVNVTVNGYQFINGEKNDWEDSLYILPGDVLHQGVDITNHGESCYLRARLSLLTEDGRQAVNSLEIQGSDRWKLAGDGYYYLDTPLEKGSVISIFDKIQIPYDLSQSEYKDTKIHLNVAVDAIQSAGFTPDFNAAAPWGPVEILEYSSNDTVTVSQVTPADSVVQITYTAADAWLNNVTDLFSGIVLFMPGDVYRDTLSIRNDTANDLTVYFRSVSDAAAEPGEKISMTISMDQTLIYDGDLKAAALKQDFKLCVIPAGQARELTFEISVPTELTNEYAGLDHTVTWIFSGAPIFDDSETTTPVRPTDPEDTLSAPSDTPDTTPELSGHDSNDASAPTGDNARAEYYLVSMLLAGGIAVCIVKNKTRRTI